MHVLTAPVARPRSRRLKDVFYMPNDNKLYLCFEYCEYDLKKYMKSQSYKLSAESIKVLGRRRRFPARRPFPWPLAYRPPVLLLLSQSFTYMMLAGLSWCHSHRIFHRCASAAGWTPEHPRTVASCRLASERRRAVCSTTAGI